MKSTEKAGARNLLFVVGGFLIPLSAALAYLLSVHEKLRRASKPGREASTAVSPDDLPLTSFTHSGRPGDPINFEFRATDGQVGTAFVAAGWYRADEIRLVTSARICVDSVLGRKYSTAPVSSLFLFGRKEDMAFERPGATVRERDHIRIWNTGRNCSDGRPTWIGSATKDTKVELARTNHLPTHHISPDVDAERALITTELTQTGYIVQETTRPGFGKPTHGFNGEGDPYDTDGQVAVLTFANVTTPPLASHVHSSLLARVAQQLLGPMRPRLPQDQSKQG